MPDLREQDLRIYRGIVEYCETYNIPRENLLEILEDQKVLPMIRGKASEYIGTAFLRQVLDPLEWTVDKLNLNPQPGTTDRDIRVTFRRTGAELTAETKTAVRASFRLRTRNNPFPHFKVKCHKSRSSLQLQSTTNDAYLVGDFDLLLCNVSNAIFRSRVNAPGMHVIDDPEAVDWLKDFYGINDDKSLFREAYDDWRMCLPISIADADGVIPRNPVVAMEDTTDWFGHESLASNLRSLINGVTE